MGDSVFKLFPPPHLTHMHTEEHHDFLRHLQPQPSNVHVSQILLKTSDLQAKDGSLITGVARIQFFYSEGSVSFGVASLVSWERHPPPIDALPPITPITSTPDTPSTALCTTRNNSLAEFDDFFADSPYSPFTAMYPSSED